MLSSEWKNVSEDFGVYHFAGLPGTYQLIYFLTRDNGAEPDRENWKKAHELYLWAFKAPKAPDEQKRLAKMLKKPVPESIQRELFEFDAFLRGLGRMSLSQCALCPPDLGRSPVAERIL